MDDRHGSQPPAHWWHFKVPQGSLRNSKDQKGPTAMLLFPIHLTKIKTVFLRWKPGVTPSLQAVYFKKITSLDNSKNVNDDYVKQWNFAKREALLEAPRKGFQA